MRKNSFKLSKVESDAFTFVEVMIATVIVVIVATIVAQTVGESARQKSKVVAASAGMAPASFLIDNLSNAALVELIDPATSHSPAGLADAIRSRAWPVNKAFDFGSIRFMRALSSSYPFSTTPCGVAAKKANPTATLASDCRALQDAMSRCRSSLSVTSSTKGSPPGMAFHSCFIGTILDTSNASFFSKQTGKTTGSKDVLFAELTVHLWNFATNKPLTSLDDFYNDQFASGFLSILTLHWSQSDRAFQQTIVRGFSNNAMP